MPRTCFAARWRTPDVEILMHGSDYDLRLLDRDLQIGPRRLFDTQVAATLLGETSLGLSALLEQHLGIKLAKKYQRADWAARPLPDDMLQYAVHDTAHLHALVDLLDAALEKAGRRHWAEEEFGLLEEIGWVDDGPDDPVGRVKAARKLPVRVVARLRELLVWRDAVARELDRAPFRVVDNRTLIALSEDPPSRVEDLRDRKGFSKSLADKRGNEVLDALRSVEDVPDSELTGYPRGLHRGPGRPPPEVEEQVDQLKRFRNAKADELNLPRGSLFPNATLISVALAEPSTTDDLRSIAGVKQWQIDVAGEDLLTALKPKA